MYQEKLENTRAERRIIEQAAHVLAEGRGRTMQEIADISGIGRTTLYRHFHTREDLIRAIQTQGLEEAHAAVVAARPDDGDAADALRRVIAGLVTVGDRYRILVEEGVPKHEVKTEYQELGATLHELVERGQREGAFTPAMSSRWILSAMGNLLMAAIKQVQEGELARNHAATIVADTLLGGIQVATRD
jgi:TetR/AcrR family transcriptional regulator, mexCD-oprJ operon repressor